MSDVTGWNRDLYIYHLLRGGDYSGAWNSEWTAQLRLDRGGVPICIRGDLERAGRYNDRLMVRVVARLELEQHYRLTISSQSKVNVGLNLLQKEDFGCPELSRERRIRTTQEQFTAQALRDGAWRESLNRCPECSLEVRSVLPGQGGVHVAALSVDEAKLVGYGALPCCFSDDPDKLLDMVRTGNTKELEGSLSVRKLDQVVELMERTVRALRVWRM